MRRRPASSVFVRRPGARASVALSCLAAQIAVVAMPFRALAAEEDAVAGANLAAVPASSEAVAAPAVEPRAVARSSDAQARGFAASLAAGPLAAASPATAPNLAVSAQSISVPKGQGTIEGMGESFSADASTGVVSFRLPIALPPIRGALQVGMTLAYGSGGGAGNAGYGWDLGVPFIARQTDRGVPRYAGTPGAFDPNQDRFVFGGGQELVPLGVVTSGRAPAAADERMPAWAEGWQLFRARVESQFLRFFWSPDGKTWRVQDKTGGTLELGAPRNDVVDDNALEADPALAGHIFRWNLARQFDVEGGVDAPVNVVRYRYKHDGGLAYLEDLYATPPVSGGASAPLTSWATHVRLAYEPRRDVSSSYRRGWRTTSGLRLARVDVASKGDDVSAPRAIVRRTHLGYGPGLLSQLASVQIEGRCEAPVLEGEGETLPASTCPRLPAMTFGYTGADIRTGGRAFGDSDVLYDRAQTLLGAPSVAIDGQNQELADIDGDGLPDILRTSPSATSDEHGIYFQGATGAPRTFGALAPLSVGPNPVVAASALTLKSPNVASLDLDADGIGDFVYMPNGPLSRIFTPKKLGVTWRWRARDLRTPETPSGYLDLTNARPSMRVLDVNADGLVDIVVSGSDKLSTYLALGRFPGGDGRFGQGWWATASTATLSAKPVESCLPEDERVVQLSDADVALGDMNGDGLVDLVRLASEKARYWPGRGDGSWGTVACGAGPSFVAMSTPPLLSAAIVGGPRLSDVNGDGFDDLVEVTPTRVNVYLNEQGHAFSREAFSLAAPTTASAAQNTVRVLDVDGSGTTDVVWGTAQDGYRFVDLLGGQRPRLLRSIANGLGKTTTFEYATSVEQMLEAARTGKAWATKMPVVANVIRRATESDNLPVAGRPANTYVTEYTYRDPIFEGRQREFRGFREATVKKSGDANSPPVTMRSQLLLGECVDETDDGVADCEPIGRWKDNPREALKGRAVVEETVDDAGVALSTVHHTYRLRTLYAGLDGRAVRTAFESATDAWLYDTGAFTGEGSSVPVTDVEVEALDGVVTGGAGTLTLSSTKGRVRTRAEIEVDRFGNETKKVARGCIEGCLPADESIAHVSVPKLLEHPSGWLWRPSATFVEGSESGIRNRQFVTYDDRGHAVVTEAVLVGSGTLDRSPLGSLGPNRASMDGSIVIAAQDYDAFGHAAFERSAENRCSRLAYDGAYATLAVSEVVYVGSVGADVGAEGSRASAAFAATRAGSGCGERALTARALHDRGMGLVKEAVGLHGERTRVQYDGFGRITALFKPHPYAVGETSPLPSLEVSYFLPEGAATKFSRLRTRTQDGVTVDDNRYRETWAYVDGLGRTIVALEQADPSAGDGGTWVVAGQTRYTAKGEHAEVFQPWFWTGEGAAYQVTETPATSSARHVFDAFGRERETIGFDGELAMRSVFHALSTDVWDKADLVSSKHKGTFATLVKDGHGRRVAALARRKRPAGLETTETRTSFLATGEPSRVTRRVLGGGPSLTRWMAYDSLGRRVLNVEPNTSVGFAAEGPAEGLKTWRYVHDDAGSLVGTSDARGCGVDYHYDAAGRIVAEDYSPCLPSHARYSAVNLATGDGAEVYYRYDAPDPDVAPGCAQDAALLPGRLSSVADRGAKTLQRPDGRGRIACSSRKIAKPIEPGAAPDAEPYAAEWFTEQTTYDAADRAARDTTGASKLLSNGGDSYVRTVYSRRGTVAAVCASYGQVTAAAPSVETDACTGADEVTLVRSIRRAPNGRPEEVTYGDLAATRTQFAYDILERLEGVRTERTAPGAWSVATPAYPLSDDRDAPTLQAVLEDMRFVHDEAGNPIDLFDLRDAAAWPKGAKPVSRHLEYDDLYRLAKITYAHAEEDTWVSPFAHENAASGGGVPRSGDPAPHVAFNARVKEQSYAYDAFGNVIESKDDALGFYDRSLGIQSHGAAVEGPEQLRRAELNADTGTGARDGDLSARYDPAGNLTTLDVRRAGPCLPLGSFCSQHYAYDWDEAGRLARARRWDAARAVDEAIDVAAADLRYAYDATGQRTLKTAVDGAGEARHTLYPTPSLELRSARFEADAYEHSERTEVPYLFAHGVRLGRVVYGAEDLPSLASGRLHVFLELPDHLGSTTLAVDLGSGELVERATYQAYGGADSDYRPERWGAFRADHRFTGKEEDIEVGLQYFGQRYYASALNRWISADPLAIHEPGKADFNVYAYVHGKVLVAVDPNGLSDVPVAGYFESAQRDFQEYFIGPAKGVARGVTEFLKSSVEGAKQVATTIVKVNVAVLTNDPRRAQEAQVRLLDHVGGFAKAPAEIAEKARDGAKQFMQGRIEDGVATGTEAALEGAAYVEGARQVARAGRGGASVAAGEAEVGVGNGSVRAARGVNPSKGAENCVSCVIAMDRTLSGSPTAALPDSLGAPYNVKWISEYAREQGFSGAWVPTTGPAGIKTIVGDWGPGSRGIVWGTRGAENGHVFNVVNQGGEVRFLDGQTGKAASTAGFKDFFILRTK